jgi:hypothetical protein
MLEYCIEVTAEYELKDYGKWPTPFPLLDVAGIAKANDDFALLAQWLLNPGLQTVFDAPASGETTTRFVAALISEWAFILLGPPSKSATPVQGDFSADDALAALLTQIVRAGESSPQKGVMRVMVEYWEDLKTLLLDVANYTDDNAVRQEVLWKRQIVRKLLDHSRSSQRSRKAAPAAKEAVA